MSHNFLSYYPIVGHLDFQFFSLLRTVLQYTLAQEASSVL